MTMPINGIMLLLFSTNHHGLSMVANLRLRYCHTTLNFLFLFSMCLVEWCPTTNMNFKPIRVIFWKKHSTWKIIYEIYVRHWSCERYKNTKFEKKTLYVKNSHFYNIRYLSSWFYKNENFEKKKHLPNIIFLDLNVKSAT
jgi:hypothetical protein